MLVQLGDIAKVHPTAQQWHIVSHGSTGELQLGGERWDMSWLEQASLNQLRALLPKGSQWYLYACDLAQGGLCCVIRTENQIARKLSNY